MSVTQFRKPQLTPAQKRIEAIIKGASDLGMGGFALAQLRTIVTQQVEPLTEALQPFADFADKVEEFVEQRAADEGSPILPTNHFRLADFKRAQKALG